jgi:allantoinase
VEINEERIVSVVNREKAQKQTKGVHVIDYGNAVIMPGLIDVYVFIEICQQFHCRYAHP